jgi:hypothetical protein
MKKGTPIPQRQKGKTVAERQGLLWGGPPQNSMPPQFRLSNPDGHVLRPLQRSPGKVETPVADAVSVGVNDQLARIW